MAQASQFSHKLLMSTALPYKTFTTPIDQGPEFVAGRNVLINSKNFCTMRPGFADYLEPTPTTFYNLRRLFGWATWDGRYFVMAVDLQPPNGVMVVYKFQVGADSSFQQIYSEVYDPPHRQFPSGVPFSFVTANNFVYFSNPTATYKWNPDYGLQIWGVAAPSITPGISLTSSGSLSSVLNPGYRYVITWFDSSSGHESGPSPVSAATGLFSSKNVIITWPTSPLPLQPEFDNVRIYRTTDGGPDDPQEMGLVATVAIHTGTYTDSTADALLSAVVFAPAYYQNDPPPKMTSIVVYAGRIWGVVGAKVWYSGQEEISNGIPQECFPGASINSPAGNFYAYETVVNALAPLPDGVAVFTANRIQKIEGDSLDTFRRYTLLAKRGTLIDYTVKVVGTSVLWFDRSTQLWLSDLGEIGKDIRPDLSRASLTNAQACIHIAGQQHWICFLDPDNQLLYVYDLDLNTWNVPWSVYATTIESIDTAPGVTRLAAAINGTQVMLENPLLYLDAGNQYGAFVATNPFDLAPDSNPDFLAVLHHVALESNQNQPVFVGVKTDENPGALVLAYPYGPGSTSGFNLLGTVTDPPRRTQGQYLVEKHYMGSPDGATPACRRLALYLQWPTTEPAIWALYSIDLAMIPVGR